MTTDLRGAVWRSGVQAAIYDHVFASPEAEVGGFLVGRVDDDRRLWIADARPALAATMTAASVTFTHDDWSAIHGHLESLSDHARIVGWYHSHPGYGIFLSRFDLFIHEHFFGDAAQVAHVVDPLAGREGLFGWVGGEVQLLQECETARAALGDGRAGTPS
jgi:proteasome lid subunit RPN8/RPN11